MKEIRTVNISKDYPTLKKTYNRGYSASGGAKEQLDAICEANNLKWHIIQGTTINVYPINGDIGGKAYVISPTMIKDTEKLQKRLESLRMIWSVPRKLGLNLTLQMNPLITAGSVIQLQGTFNADGNYVIDKVSHDGSYEGEAWDTKIECTVYA